MPKTCRTDTFMSGMPGAFVSVAGIEKPLRAAGS
jgi:hypothetical protein